MLILYINQADMQFDPALLRLSLLRRETFLRALIVSVWLNCRRRIGHGTRSRQPAGGRQVGVGQVGWGMGRPEQRRMEGRGSLSLARSLTGRSLHQFLST